MSMSNIPVCAEKNKYRKCDILSLIIIHSSVWLPALKSDNHHWSRVCCYYGSIMQQVILGGAANLPVKVGGSSTSCCGL